MILSEDNRKIFSFGKEVSPSGLIAEAGKHHMITNLNASKVAYLATVASKVNFSEESFQTIPGEVIAGEEHPEYHVDDEVLYQMILDTFYVKQVQ